MFRKLRNRLIWINLGITTAVIVVTFTAIYLFATQAANRRPPVAEQGLTIYSDDVGNMVQILVEQEKRAAANDLMITLVISGVVIEIAVAIVSYYLAEEAIKPVREAYEAQKVFIANASHEIKTPLAAIAANLEAAGIHGNKWISNVEKETEKLTGLNNELLALARTDLVEKSALDEVDLKKIALDNLKSFESRLGNKKLETRINTHDKVKLAANDFLQVMSILMDNAIKYSDKKIVFALSNDEMTVTNDGAEIAEKDLPHVFERFYQAVTSAEGVGLGLSIAKSVAMRNGWELDVTSAKNSTEFILKF